MGGYRWEKDGLRYILRDQAFRTMTTNVHGPQKSSETPKFSVLSMRETYVPVLGSWLRTDGGIPRILLCVGELYWIVDSVRAFTGPCPMCRGKGHRPNGDQVIPIDTSPLGSACPNFKDIPNIIQDFLPCSSSSGCGGTGYNTTVQFNVSEYNDSAEYSETFFSFDLGNELPPGWEERHQTNDYYKKNTNGSSEDSNDEVTSDRPTLAEYVVSECIDKMKGCGYRWPLTFYKPERPAFTTSAGLPQHPREGGQAARDRVDLQSSNEEKSSEAGGLDEQD